ncbi:MAG: glutaminase [Bacteroidales bacterium]|nr:glutaminase [Bacteroidales bacterium]
MNYQKIIEEISAEVLSSEDNGKVACYIPALSKVNPHKYGINLVEITGENFSFGDFDEKFSIQSIAKVFSLLMAYSIEGESLWKRVDVEPSGDPFNSLVQLEYENGIPRNPFINAGALVICDVLFQHLNNPKEDFLAFVRKISNNQNLFYNKEIALSEKEHGYRNAAMINLMKAFGNINNNIDEVLDFYFNLCSIEMSTKELSNTFLIFANGGKLVNSNEEIISGSKTKRVNAVMQTCGFYDEAGEFTFKVGLPGKSGVGGGIVAVYPGKYSVAVWSPKLNKKGNSVKGMKTLELLTTKTKMSIF